jgi:hypothetical protein
MSRVIQMNSAIRLCCPSVKTHSSPRCEAIRHNCCKSVAGNNESAFTLCIMYAVICLRARARKVLYHHPTCTGCFLSLFARTTLVLSLGNARAARCSLMRTNCCNFGRFPPRFCVQLNRRFLLFAKLWCIYIMFGGPQLCSNRAV